MSYSIGKLLLTYTGLSLVLFSIYGLLFFTFSSYQFGGVIVLIVLGAKLIISGIKREDKKSFSYFYLFAKTWLIGLGLVIFGFLIYSGLFPAKQEAQELGLLLAIALVPQFIYCLFNFLVFIFKIITSKELIRRLSFSNVSFADENSKKVFKKIGLGLLLLFGFFVLAYFVEPDPIEKKSIFMIGSFYGIIVIWSIFTILFLDLLKPKK
ncbi:MAG TPA: hypothetical protein PKK60_04350 [archaeon]|nr:hypothetical protein [archaeon]